MRQDVKAQRRSPVTIALEACLSRSNIGLEGRAAAGEHSMPGCLTADQLPSYATLTPAGRWQMYHSPEPDCLEP